MDKSEIRYPESLKYLKNHRIAVLCGGPGVEREVSLNSGLEVYKALDSLDLNVSLRDIEGENDVSDAVKDIDVVVLMLHGEFGEDGEIQSILDQIGIPYTGSDTAASALAMDKHKSKEKMKNAGLPTPQWRILSATDNPKDVFKQTGFPFPIVIKPNARGSSVGISIVKSEEELIEGMQKALSVDEQILMEEFIEGRELTAAVWDREALPLIELRPDGTFYDYYAKYQSDKTAYLCPAPLTEKETQEGQTLALRLYEILDLRDIARIDMILNEKGFMLLEANTAPGFTSHSLVPKAAKEAGWSMPDLCAELAAKALKRKGEVS